VMLVMTGSVFTLGSGLFIWDFFRTRPRFEIVSEPASPGRRGAELAGVPT
jgi:hypothetical protein